MVSVVKSIDARASSELNVLVERGLKSDNHALQICYAYGRTPTATEMITHDVLCTRETDHAYINSPT